ncbi:MAG: 50S ribosomal protein L24e [Thermoproteota archaeon]
MPKPKKCTFCGREFTPGTGIMYVSNNGSVYWFCSSKCRKNQLELNQDPRKLKWTMYYGMAERAKARREAPAK